VVSVLASYQPGRSPEVICQTVTPFETAYGQACRDRINARYRELRATTQAPRAECERQAFDETARDLLNGSWSPDVDPFRFAPGGGKP
jgi:hypothetical protein